MKLLIILMLVFCGGMNAHAQFDALPDSPLDTSMGDAAGDVGGTLNQIEKNDDFERETAQEQERQEELLENRYDVPDDKDDEEFNQNGPNNP